MKKEMDKIADYLLLRSSYMQELGLFHGKMGVVVALYLYADAYGDEVMREYAWELFQQVYDGVARYSGKEQSALPGIRCHGRFE